MLTFLGFAMVLTFMVLIMTQRLSALIALIVIPVLFALFGGNLQDMRHFLRTENRHLAGVPLQQMGQVQGLVRVVEYLDAIRGKV